MIVLSEELKGEEFENSRELIHTVEEISSIRGFLQIDWDDAMEMMRAFSKTSQDKFNIYPETISDEEDLNILVEVVDRAFEGSGPMIRRYCMDCGKEYKIFLSEKSFFESRGMNLPKRCKDCRKKKRDKKQEMAHE